MYWINEWEFSFTCIESFLYPSLFGILFSSESNYSFELFTQKQYYHINAQYFIFSVPVNRKSNFLVIQNHEVFKLIKFLNVLYNWAVTGQKMIRETQFFKV